jgi:Spy/CpxP family protein refolding chaperone
MTALQSKITRMTLLAVCSAALTAPLALFAQDTPPAPLPPASQSGGGPGGGRGGNPQERDARQLAMMTTQLNLTDAQQAQVKQILADSSAKMMALRSDDSTPMDQKRPKMMAIMQDRTAAVRAVLTPDQQTKYDAMVEQMRQRMGGGGGGTPPPPPPPQQ